MSLVRRIARPLLASIFITEGIDTLRHPDMRVARAEPALEKVEQMAEPLGVSVDAKTAVRINGAVMTVAGGLLAMGKVPRAAARSEEHTSELQSRGHLVCRLLPAKQ